MVRVVIQMNVLLKQVDAQQANRKHDINSSLKENIVPAVVN